MSGVLYLGATANTSTYISGSNISIGYKLYSGSIHIGTNQISGTLNIGTSVGRSNTSIINIGTGSTAQMPINIGSNTTTTNILGKLISSDIGTTGPILSIGTETIIKNIIIGHTFSVLENKGLFTSNKLITATRGIYIGDGYGISYAPGSYTPNISQLGGFLYNLDTTVKNIPLASNSTAFITTSGLPIGTYWISFSGNINNTPLTPTAIFIPTFIISGVNSYIAYHNVSATNAIFYGFSYSGVIQVTTLNGTIGLSGYMTGAVAKMQTCTYSLIRVA